jgi:hypothetical protein
MVSGDGKLAIAPIEGGIRVDAEPRGSDRWAYVALPLSGQVPRGATGLACTVKLEEGAGVFRGIFVERSGSAYVAELAIQPIAGQATRTIALLDGVIPGYGWSPTDPNGRLDLDEIVAVRLGCNTEGSTLRFTITDLRWVASGS